ncbi:MAG: alpha-glucosidase [Spirochaetes bacterium]|nr:alpha-glucosidase [Spirochaetota bacterium]MBN2769600.1 alpha-glucosidase [Spirochaetota bacterium]
MKGKHIWWKHGVIYQIYPRSFYDSNNDGIGDIKGITLKLDYLKELGISGIWISPFYKSPKYDFGYDISDYRSIDPDFGTEKDFKELIKEAHKRKIHIILDMVINHTSHQHPWFIDSSSSRQSAKHDWYLWVDGKKGKFPNNWMSAFGGHAWHWSIERQQYYLHLFLKEQPDLNWRNPDVQKAVFSDIEFWLKLGVDGFRLDVINYIVKDKDFKNNPYFLHKTKPRRHDLQHHQYDRNQPETHIILKKLRKLMDNYGETMLVGEVYPDEDVMKPEIPASYLGNGKDELHLAFDFSAIFAKFSAKCFRKMLTRWYNAIPQDGWPCHVLSNHDKSRAISRLAKGNPDKAKLLMTLLLTQYGTPFLYYGEEIGMTDVPIKRKDIVDPPGKQYWPFYKGRDGVRTPMQWNSKKNSGFSNAKPWLPVSKDSVHINVKSQYDKHDSMLNYTKTLIRLRQTLTSLNRGSINFETSHSSVLAYNRTHQSESVIILLNFSRFKKSYNLPSNDYHIVLDSLNTNTTITFRNNIVLQPYQALIINKENS